MRPFGKLFVYSHDLARIVANIMCDGHLQMDGKRGSVSFYSKKLSEILRENKRFEKLFGVTGHVYPDRRSDGYKLFVTSKEIAAFLESAGVPAGNKTNKKYGVPSWILNSDKKTRLAYLKGVFNSEASVYKTTNGKYERWRIHISQYKNTRLRTDGIKFMNQIKNMLNDFGIFSSPVRCAKGNKRKDGTDSICIQFEIERKNFVNFIKYIGFEDPKKHEKLLSAVRGVKRG